MIQVEAEMGELSAAIEVALDQSMQAGNTIHALRILGGTRCQPHEELSVVVAEPGYAVSDPFDTLAGLHDGTRSLTWSLKDINSLSRARGVREQAGLAPYTEST